MFAINEQSAMTLKIALILQKIIFKNWFDPENVYYIYL